MMKNIIPNEDGCMSDIKKDPGVRVRFAPSPTGMLHIGGARTAIYNWAFAKSCGGTFILRIEDTDPERSTEENTQIILRALRWLGLNWDEGPEVGGACGPYFQTQRTETYQAALDKLIANGCAYPCFCTKEELDAKRERAQKEHGGYDGYDGTCRKLSREEAQSRINAGEPHVWRLAVPEDRGDIEFDDAVYGHMSFPADTLDDMIIKRSDGTFTYNFAVVCDDANMGITHVIRGDDHLANTPKQILIYEACGFDVPTFAHLPMILGPDGHKLSKRHGATSVEEYRDRGFLPEAMVNYLALLGWSLDGETTIIPEDVLCSKFSLERINRKDSVFDEKKLEWMNGVYIRNMDADSWVYAATPWLARAKVDGESVETGAHIVDASESEKVGAPDSGVGAEVWQQALAAVSDEASFSRALFPLVSERLARFDEIPQKLAYMFWGPNIALDEKSVNKVLLKEGARAYEALTICRSVLESVSGDWREDAVMEECKAKGEAAGFKPKTLLQPLRVAVTGNMVSPPLFESIKLLDMGDVLSRIDKTCDLVFKEI